MTGTASRGPTYPTIPHTLLVAVAAGRRFPAPARPLGFHDLPGPAEGQGVGGDVLGHDAARGDIRPFSDGDGGHEGGVAADERAALDAGGMFGLAVVVAGDVACADVH